MVEASPDLALAPGIVVIGRAGQHLKIARNPQRVVLDRSPADKPHFPSVDVLFASAAEAFGSRVLALVLTGMGDDGLAGARVLKSHGATVLTEAQSSCVVYGMPRSVAEAGLSDAAVRLDRIVATLDDHL